MNKYSNCCVPGDPRTDNSSFRELRNVTQDGQTDQRTDEVKSVEPDCTVEKHFPFGFQQGPALIKHKRNNANVLQPKKVADYNKKYFILNFIFLLTQ